MSFQPSNGGERGNGDSADPLRWPRGTAALGTSGVRTAFPSPRAEDPRGVALKSGRDMHAIERVAGGRGMSGGTRCFRSSAMVPVAVFGRKPAGRTESRRWLAVGVLRLLRRGRVRPVERGLYPTAHMQICQFGARVLIQ